MSSHARGSDCRSSTDPSSSKFSPLDALYDVDINWEKFDNEKLEEGVDIFHTVQHFERHLLNEKQKQDGTYVELKKGENKSFCKLKKMHAEADKRDLTKIKRLMRERLEDDKKRGIKRPRQELAMRNLHENLQALCLGPYDVLRKAMKRRRLVRVYVRHCSGLRGVLIGFIKSFDRFMNLVMSDTHEVFAHAPSGEAAEHQRKLSVAMIDEAVRMMGLEVPVTDFVPRDRDTAKCKVFQKNMIKSIQLGGTLECKNPSGTLTVDEASLRKKPPAADASVSAAATTTVKMKKPKDCKGRKFPGLLKFKGGPPTLFHRFLECTYVRGDNIVIAALVVQEKP